MWKHPLTELKFIIKSFKETAREALVLNLIWASIKNL